MTATTLFDGSTNGRRFRAHVTDTLVPLLKRGDTVILDNLGAHKVAGVREAIRAAGAKLLYLPQWTVIEPFMPRNQPGPEGKADRRIISGILHVITAGCRWCDCPDAYGPSTTIYNRFNCWSLRGFWRAMLTALAKAGWAGDAAALDSTYLRAHRSAHGGKKGGRAQGIGPSRGGQTTKVHALTDVLGRPGVLLLTPGNASGVTTAPAVLAEATGRICRLAGDKGYDANWLRADLRAMGMEHDLRHMASP